MFTWKVQFVVCISHDQIIGVDHLLDAYLDSISLRV